MLQGIRLNTNTTITPNILRLIRTKKGQNCIGAVMCAYSLYRKYNHWQKRGSPDYISLQPYFQSPFLYLSINSIICGSSSNRPTGCQPEGSSRVLRSFLVRYIFCCMVNSGKSLTALRSGLIGNGDETAGSPTMPKPINWSIWASDSLKTLKLQSGWRKTSRNCTHC